MDISATWPQIRDWRKQQRATLIARRESLSKVQHHEWNKAMTNYLESGFPALTSLAIGFCWPFKGEFDARFALHHFREHGASAALPVVVTKSGPLQFREWWPGAPMKPGVYDIPVPEGTELVMPDAAIVPMNGFDDQGYRLGYGGGYFDRTLAAAVPRPLAIGVSFEFARLPTIHPQPHDIAMDFIVTEAGIYTVERAHLVRIGAAVCQALTQQLLEARGLPRRGAADPGAYSSPAC